MLTNEWASRCSTTSCVEARRVGGGAEIRNSTDPDGPRIWLADDDWRYMLAAIRDGRHIPHVDDDATSDTVVLVSVVEVAVTRSEWEQFQAAVRAGSFNIEPATADVA